MIQRCKKERRILENSLAIASQSPDQFAYNLMKGPGYMAITAGEVVHIIKCLPVEVKIAHGENCYEELAVTRNNKTMFLTPKTHILKSRGVKIECNGLFPTYYQINENWYKVLPKLTEAKSPTILRPISQATWNYNDPASLATSGIYTEKDLDQLRDRIMFPMDQPALLNDVAREMHGHVVTDNEGAISRLLKENAIEKIISNTWNNMWTKFTTFRSVSAGIFTIIIVIQGIKMILGVFLKGYALHRIYGWSTHLLSALWGSLATLFISLGQERYQQAQPANLDEEMHPVHTEERYVHAPAPSFPVKPPNTPSGPPLKLIPKATYVVVNENSHAVEVQNSRDPVRFSF